MKFRPAWLILVGQMAGSALLPARDSEWAASGELIAFAMILRALIFKLGAMLSG
jgi:hypothetical protein